MSGSTGQPIRESNAPAMLAWGMRRFWWALALGAVLGALVVPLYRFNQPPDYQARALVVASQLQTSLTALPRYATAIFDNGAVAEAVSTQFGAAGDPEDVLPNKASVVAPQDSIVIEVYGHEADPDTAADIANVAAETFVQELNSAGEGVGTFTLQSRAVPPVEAEEAFRAAPYSLALGAFGGLLVALGLVLLLLLWRRPVVQGSPVGEMVAASTVRYPKGRSRRNPVGVLPGMTSVVRKMAASRLDTVFVLSSSKDKSARDLISRSLRHTLGTLREEFGRVDVVVLDDIEHPELATPHPGHHVVVVVTEGTARSNAERLVSGLVPAEGTVVVAIPVRRLRQGDGQADEADTGDDQAAT